MASRELFIDVKFFCAYIGVNFGCFYLPKFIIILHYTIMLYNKEKQKSSPFLKKVNAK